MAQRHLIGSVSLDFRASRQTDGIALQTEVSDWFWQDVLPELDRMIDEVVPSDTVIRIDRLSIELPAVGKLNWKEKLTQSVCRAIAEEIIRRRLFPRPTDSPVQNVSPAMSHFDAWLHFIRTGQRQFSMADPSEWATASLSLIATSPAAVASFRRLIRTDPIAIERLVRQHDDEFLGQLMEALTGNPAHELLRWQSAFRSLFAASWWQQILGNPMVESGKLELIFWILIFEKPGADSNQPLNQEWIGSSDFFYLLLERVTPYARNGPTLAPAIAHFFRQKHRQESSQKKSTLIPKNQQRSAPFFDETALQRAVREALQNLPESERLIRLFSKVLIEQSTTIAALPENRTNPVENRGNITPESDSEPTSTVPRVTHDPDIGSSSKDIPKQTDAVDEGTVFYIDNAGIVLLHPFLAPFLAEVGLQPDNKANRRRAVQLIHYLATGETKTPEYELLLPKILAGFPLNQPIDRSIRLTKTEKKEAQSLLEMVISYWLALGSTSPEGLREGFLRREGRLSKRDNGWLLQVETQTIDILLDQLPWGIGVIRQSWMTDFLYVEWH